MPQPTYSLALDISTSVVGVCLLENTTPPSRQPVVLDAVKLTSTKLTTMWDKADFALSEIVRLVGPTHGPQVTRIYVEENAKRFAPGLSSADVILTLAKMNGIMCFLCHRAFNKAPVIDVNVSSARKAVGFKNTMSDKRPVKDKVFEYVTTMYPSFPWKQHLAKTGGKKGQVVFDLEMKDAADAWVVGVGGSVLNGP